jgi:predicted TIM-barrel fold metal-dependent hydrolase
MPNRIDVHHHYLPDFYLRALEIAGRSPPDGMPATPTWSEAEALRTMDRLGIAKAYLSISSPGVHFGDDRTANDLARQCNDEGARLKRAHPDRFGFFACTPLPDADAALREIVRSFEVLDADGVVFETNFHGLYLGDGALAPIYAELDRRAAVLFVHPTGSPCGCGTSPEGKQHGPALGYPSPMLEFIFDTTRAVTQMILSGTLARNPRIRLVVPHAGAALPILAERIDGFLGAGLKPSPDTPADIRKALHDLHYDLAGAPVPEMLQALLGVADPAKLHYGSDWPFTPMETCEDLVRILDQTPLLAGALREAVMNGNAKALFKPGT